MSTPPPETPLSSAPLIDLGADFDVVPRAPRRIHRAEADPILRPVRIRSGWLAVPLIAVVLLVSGASRPAAPPLALVAHVATGRNASVVVNGDTVIVVDGDDGDDHIRAYDLRDRHAIWSQKLALSAEEVSLRLDGAEVVASTDGNALNHLGTEVFDLASGRLRWRNSASVSTVITGGDLLMQDGPDGSDALLQRVAAQTGAVRWSLPLAAGCATSFGQDGAEQTNALVAICFRTSTKTLRSVDAPTLRVVDLGTGAVTTTRNLTYHTNVADFYLPPTARLPSPELVIVGDLALVAHNNIPTPTIDAFNSMTLTPTWAGMSISDIDSLEACGADRICVYAGAATSVISQETGKPIPGAVPPSPATPPARLVLVPVSADYPDEPSFVVPLVPAGMDVSVPRPEAGDAWLSQQLSSGLRQIQPIHHVGTRACFRTEKYLACSTAADNLTFWRLPAL